MLKNLDSRVVALEEHYWDHELSSLYSGGDTIGSPHMRALLLDHEHDRLAAMDGAGIDIQVLSHAPPSTQKLPHDVAVPLTRRVNDRLAQIVARHPQRFAGFAALPTAQPAAAADELERCVREHGFKGAMIHGLVEGTFVDHRRFWPIFARAEAMDVPIYLHPAVPQDVVVDAYYKDYEKEFPMFPRAAWGYTVESATQAIRMVLSGVFEEHPRLKIILGHLGEGVPFLLWRIDEALARPGHKPLNFAEVFRRNFWITTSGFFSDNALVCSIKELGSDRVLFSVDYPFVLNETGTSWLAKVPLTDAEKTMLAGGNARRLLRL
jgi:predicted TIM-barrel fold metal-dependent hydrolase